MLDRLTATWDTRQVRGWVFTNSIVSSQRGGRSLIRKSEAVVADIEFAVALGALHLGSRWIADLLLYPRVKSGSRAASRLPRLQCNCPSRPPLRYSARDSNDTSTQQLLVTSLASLYVQPWTRAITGRRRRLRGAIRTASMRPSRNLMPILRMAMARHTARSRNRYSRLLLPHSPK